MISLVLMVPTMLLMHLRVPRIRPVVETLCLMPLVIPPVVLVAGVLAWCWPGDRTSCPARPRRHS